MRILHCTYLDPLSRIARIHLAEKMLDFTLNPESMGPNGSDLYRLSPTGEVPILEDNGTIVPDGHLIPEYLEDTYTENVLLPHDPPSRLETRRLISWINHKFYDEVTRYLVNERVTKPFKDKTQPKSEVIRAGRANLKPHLKYFEFLLEKRNWISGDTMTLADITLAGHLSCLDYLNEIDWLKAPILMDWYQKFKSRLSMKEILKDRIPHISPPSTYSNLDF